jgi:hypothetical protein
MRVPRADILTVEDLGVVSPLTYGGWGWRTLGDGHHALVLDHGPVVKIVMTDQTTFIIGGPSRRRLLSDFTSPTAAD